jgi:hypothetical protein
MWSGAGGLGPCDKPGCLENFSCHRGGHRFKMHPIPEMLNAPGEAIHCGVSSSLIKIVGPSFAVGFLAREHVKDTAHDHVCHSDNRPILPTPCREALIQRREIRPLRAYGGMGELGQDGSRGCQEKCVTFSHLYPLPKQQHKLIEGRFPLRNWLGPLFGDVLQPHIQHFHDRLVIG